MEITLRINKNQYEDSTIIEWQNVWDIICKMTYEGTNKCENIITKPGNLYIDGRKVYDKREKTHSREYLRLEPDNIYLLTLDNVWKQYSSYYGTKELIIVPEFKKLVVPYPLFHSIGIPQWFRYSFPNCEVIYWNI